MTTEDDTIQMREFSLNIECNNAAFDGAMTGPEIARILMGLAHELRDCIDIGTGSFVLRDANGNRVGTAQLETQDYRR